MYYWDRRYLSGGNSGSGSVGKQRDWCWSQIGDISNKEVLDIGCGDLSFWEGRDCLKYTGVDLSEIIINKNKEKRPNWNFIHADASKSQNLNGQVVFCLNLLYHILDDSVYQDILKNLEKWTKEKLFIFTWRENPFNGKTTDGWYQSYRPFMEYVHILEPLKLVESLSYARVGALYIFER